MIIKYHVVVFFLSLMPLTVDLAMADNQLSSWSVKGFGTLAATGTDTDQIGFYRDSSQTQDVTSGWGITTDSRLGLQVDWQASDSLHTTVQWIARDHAGNFGEQNLDLAFLRWSIQNDLDIRLGRVSPDVFLLSDYRNIGYAYPWMRPPHEFYANIPFYHFDGADITKKFSLNDGYLSVKIFGGYSYNQLPAQTGTINNQQSPATGVSLHYEDSLWRAQFGYAYVTITSEPPIQDLLDDINSPLLAQVWPDLKYITPALTMRGKEYHYFGVGGAYDDGTWLSQIEASYNLSNTLWNPSQVSAYFSVGKRFSTVTLYSLLGIAKSFPKDINVPSPLLPIPSLINTQQQLSQLVTTNEFNEQSVSVGTRWDFYENMALKAQWSHYWLGKNMDSRLWQQPTGNVTPSNVNVMSVGIDFMF